MTPTHTAANSGTTAVTEPERAERLVRLALAVERVATELLMRVEWLEQDVRRMQARERGP